MPTEAPPSLRAKAEVPWPHSRLLSPGSNPHLRKPHWPPGGSWSSPGTFLPGPLLFLLPRTRCYLIAGSLLQILSQISPLQPGLSLTTQWKLQTSISSTQAPPGTASLLLCFISQQLSLSDIPLRTQAIHTPQLTVMNTTYIILYELTVALVNRTLPSAYLH